MKKILSLCLVIIFVLGLVACGDDQAAQNIILINSDQTESDTSSLESESEESTSSAASSETCDHKWKAATCTKPKTCTLCKATSGAAAGHKWEEATCQKLKTCKVCKKGVGEKAEHDYTNGKCSVCSKKDPNFGELDNHSWQLLKSSRLIEFNFVNKFFGEYDVKEVSKMTSDEKAIFQQMSSADTIMKINGKDWFAYNGKSMQISYKVEKKTITISVSDPNFPDEMGKFLVMKKVADNKLKVTKCELKGYYWKIKVGDEIIARDLD